MSQWPDTTSTPVPRDHPHEAARWLFGRHPVLAGLAARVPDLLHQDDDGTWGVDLNWLAWIIGVADGVHEPNSDRRLLGERIDPGAVSATLHAIGVMSGTERTRLRLLACLAEIRVPLRYGDLSGLDGEGQRLLADWCQTLQAH